MVSVGGGLVGCPTVVGAAVEVAAAAEVGDTTPGDAEGAKGTSLLGAEGGGDAVPFGAEGAGDTALAVVMQAGSIM